MILRQAFIEVAALLLCIIISTTVVSGQGEICNNSIDDDGDGLIDLNDDECLCEIITPVSLIPNPSFEDLNCCPSDRSALNCATDWIQASRPTTDFIHTCDWLGWDQFPVPRPFPDGQGVMGFRDGRVRSGSAEPQWKEYAGACLINPLISGTTYRFQFDVGFVDDNSSPPIDITFFGTDDCANLPFGDDQPDFGCPSNGPDWNQLADVNVSSIEGDTWVNTFIEITPEEDIYAIAIGPSCEAINHPQSTYYFFDNLLLTDITAFDLVITEIMHPCNDNYTLTVRNNANFQYQWYLDGIALMGETAHELSNNYGEGSYQVRVLQNEDCRLSEEFEYRRPFDVAPANISICDGEEYSFGALNLVQSGVYIDTFKNVNNCDSIVMLDLEVIGSVYDTLPLSIYRGQSIDISGNTLSEEGSFPLVLESTLGCDSLLLVQLEFSDVYIPNVFYPNSASGNDVFKPIIAEDLMASYEIQIFDRWGGLIYRGVEWQGADAPTGVYMYKIDVQFAQGLPETFYGDVTLIK